MIKFKKLLWLFFLSLFFLNVYGQEAPYTFRNPVLPGLTRPSVCRVGETIIWSLLLLSAIQGFPFIIAKTWSIGN